MDPAQPREPVAPVAAEVLVQALVGVDAQELPDTFNGQDLTVGQGRLGAALVQPLALAGQSVVDQAEHGDDEGHKLHGRPSCDAVMASPAAYEGLYRQLLKPAHRVSYLPRRNGRCETVRIAGAIAEAGAVRSWSGQAAWMARVSRL
jgi:hypothetical protein